MRNGKLLTAIVIVVCTLIYGRPQAQNFTNRGKEFWVGYGHNQLFALSTGSSPANSQTMLLYLSAEEAAEVTVSIPGTSWSKTYRVAANTAMATDPLPKGEVSDGGVDCRLKDDGLFKNNVFIKSNVPIAVFAHTYGQNSSAATMLLPVEVYGYTYFSMNTAQSYSGADRDCFSWFYVVASEDNTTVRINPSRPTKGGKERNEAFEVKLNRGEIYNVLGALQNQQAGYDLSGSKIQSVPGSDGNCHPIGVFSGSSRVEICPVIDFDGNSGGDFMMQQGFPASAWGKNYLTAVTTSSNGLMTSNANFYRVYIRELGTKVYRNGVQVTGLQNNSFYEFQSYGADYITSTAPVMVAQIIPSGLGCGFTGVGDPEMIYLSPVEQAIKKVSFFNTNQQNILYNFLTLIIPDKGLETLKIDGVSTFDRVYSHPNMPGYSVVVKALPLTTVQHRAVSEYGFTGITYGLGKAESYGYNIGSYVSNLSAIPIIRPDNANTAYSYVCTKTPFHLSVQSIYEATSITLHFSQVKDVTPATDVTIPNPTVAGTTIINGRTYYTYDLPDVYQFSVGGDHVVPLSVTSPSIDNCSQSEIVDVIIPVYQGPSVDFSVQAGCASEDAKFSFVPVSADARLVRWEFHDGASSMERNPVRRYLTGGSFPVKLQVIRDVDGCKGDTVKQVTIKQLPSVAFDLPEHICMPEGKASFRNKTTISGDAVLSYQWQFGDNKTSVEINPFHQYENKGAYIVKLKASGGGCADSVEALLPAESFRNIPIAGIAASDTAFCVKQQAGFIDNSTYNTALSTSWLWEFADGSNSTVRNPWKVFEQSGEYSVTMTITVGGCVSAPATKKFRVYNPPVAEAGTDVIIAAGEQVRLNGNADEAIDVSWSPLVHLTGGATLHPVVSPLNDQRYYLTATGKAGCSSYDSVLVKVYNDLKIPNIITPNGDGINDIWDIRGLQNYKQATVELFNRWGQRVYRISGGYSRPWDGRDARGTELPGGTYYYIIQPGANGYGKISGALTIVR